MADITDETNEGRGMSVISLCWGIGVIIGPMVGGLMSEPATKYPFLFSHDGLFGQFPYLLPCLIIASISLVGFLVGLKHLPEPPTRRKRKAPSNEEVSAVVVMEESSESGAVIPEGGEDEKEEVSSPHSDEKKEMESFDGVELLPTATEKPKRKWLSCLRRSTTYKQFDDEGPSKRTSESNWAAVKSKNVICSILAYCLLRLTAIMVDEAFPLWTSLSSKEGGLSFSSQVRSLVFCLTWLRRSDIFQSQLVPPSSSGNFWFSTESRGALVL